MEDLQTLVEKLNMYHNNFYIANLLIDVILESNEITWLYTDTEHYERIMSNLWGQLSNGARESIVNEMNEYMMRVEDTRRVF